MAIFVRVKKLDKLLDDEIASMNDILDYNYDYYKNRGKSDYNQTFEAAYLQGRIDSLRAIKRHILSNSLPKTE